MSCFHTAHQNDNAGLSLTRWSFYSCMGQSTALHAKTRPVSCFQFREIITRWQQKFEAGTFYGKYDFRECPTSLELWWLLIQINIQTSNIQQDFLLTNSPWHYRFIQPFFPNQCFQWHCWRTALHWIYFFCAVVQLIRFMKDLKIRCKWHWLDELCRFETKLCRKFEPQGRQLVIIDPGHCSLSCWVKLHQV